MNLVAHQGQSGMLSGAIQRDCIGRGKSTRPGQTQRGTLGGVEQRLSGRTATHHHDLVPQYQVRGALPGRSKTHPRGPERPDRAIDLHRCRFDAGERA